jgi:hypothetical protein
VGGKAGHKNFFDDIERKLSKGGNKSIVGLHISKECVALLGEFFERLAHNSDFIVKTLQFLARFD